MARKVTIVEGITEYLLENGLKVLLFPDASKPTATVCMTYLVGSRHENYGETGMAHLLEHMMFKGSKFCPNPTKEFTRRGFRMNGTTGLDRTNYYLSFTANEDNLNWALGWMADSMVNSFIAKSDLDTEMTVVRNEFEMGENKPLQVLFKRIRSIAFDFHNYGHATIGARSDIENIKIENLQAFYRRHYQPDNAILTVSGKFDESNTLKTIEKIFGSIHKPERNLPPEWTKEAVADGPRYVEVRRKGEAKIVMVAYRTPSALHPDTLALTLGANIFGNMPRGRLYKALVETGLATQVFAQLHGAICPNLIFIWAIVNKDADEEKVLNALIKTIESSLEEAPITNEELLLEITEQKNQFERLFADPEKFAIQISNFIALGDWRLFFVQRDSFERYLPDTVTLAWKKYITRDNRIVGMFLPANAVKRAEIPDAPNLEEILKSHTFNKAGTQSEVFDATPENINLRTERLTIGKLHFALLSKSSRGETVEVCNRFRYGNLESLRHSQILRTLMDKMLLRGTSKMTRKEISDTFTKLKIKGTIGRFSTSRDNLIPALKFMGHLWRDSVFDHKEFEEQRREYITNIQAYLDNPQSLAYDALTEHFNTYDKGDPRYHLTAREALEAIREVKVEDVKRFYEEQFGCLCGEVAIVGDFDVEALKQELSAIFNKASRVPYERLVNDYQPIPSKRIVINTPDKENASIMARVAFSSHLDDEDAMAIRISNWIFGGSPGLSNRLANRLRKKEGFSYSVGSTVTLPEFGNMALWSMQAIVAPQNLSKAETALIEEIERVLKDGFTQEELDEAIHGYIDTQAVRRSQDRAIASDWLNLLELNRDWSEALINEEKVRALTLREVNAAFRKMIDLQNLTIVLAGDQQKAKI